jgi:secreted trypsin-like serine protease
VRRRTIERAGRVSATSGCVLLVALLVVAGASAQPRAQSSIVGGTTTSGARGLAYLRNRDLSAACSGTIVSSNVILTAAHCVVDLDRRTISPPDAVEVRTGTVDVNDVAHTQLSGVTRIVVDSLFNTRTLTNDAALLQLATPTTSLPLALAGPGDLGLLTPGTPAGAFGWGLLNGTDVAAPTTLHSGLVYVQSPAYCAARDRLFAASLEFCAVDPAGLVATCHGDSGGPLLAVRADQSLAQIGITSRSATSETDSCSPATPSVFTRVDALSAWVNSWVAALAPPPPTPVAPAPVATVAPVAAPVATPVPTPSPARHWQGRSRHARTWITLSADGKRITKVRLALRVSCRGGWYASFENTWKTNAALPPGRATVLRLAAWKNRYWSRSEERITVDRSDDGSVLTVSASASARARNHRLGSCSARPPAMSATLSR